MSDESFRSTWKDRKTGFVHAATASGLGRARGGMRQAANIVTDCGLPVDDLSTAGDGEVTCGLCLSADDIRSLTDKLDVPVLMEALRGLNNGGYIFRW